jgi:hypothetical protein
MTSVQQLWMGYTDDKGRATLDLGNPGSKILLLGSRAADLARVTALSAKEAGASPAVFDLDGSVARSLSGYLDTYDYRSFLYDSFRLEEPEAWHSQMAAAAYAQALDLSSEEEAILNAAMQLVASDSTLLSPISLHDVMGKVEGFRGFYVDKLNGKIGALSLFDAADDVNFGRLMAGDLIIDFHLAPYPLAAELATALFLAKMLAIAHSKGQSSGFLLLTEAHRIFRASPRPAHSNRLLSHLLEWPATIAMSTEQPHSLSPLMLQSCSVRVYSSDAWHSQPRHGRSVLSGTFVLHDRRSERRQSFVPRRVLAKTADYVQARSGRYITTKLAEAVLDVVERFPLSTPESIAQYVAPDFLTADVNATLANLERQGCIILEPKDSGSGPRVFAYTLADKGRKLLKELRE